MRGETDAGEHSVIWDGTDGRGRPVGSGVFWVQLRTGGGYVSSKQMLVMR